MANIAGDPVRAAITTEAHKILDEMCPMPFRRRALIYLPGLVDRVTAAVNEVVNLSRAQATDD